jgi:hypothetical protein
MQNKKMTNPTDGINESNKKLRAIYDQLCCIKTAITPSTTYNELGTVSLSGSETFVFGPGEDIPPLHSFSWELGTGASIEINNGLTNTIFETNGSVTFSTTNTQVITLFAIGGTVNIIYIY